MPTCIHVLKFLASLPDTQPVVLTNSFSSHLELEGEQAARLRDEAARARDGIFGKTVFVRAVVEISNFCRENCGYCAMRRDNRGLTRFRLSADEVFEEILSALPEAVTDLNIQAGEDPRAVREVAIPLVRRLREETALGLSICLGTLSARDYGELREAGADYYVIKIETGDSAHFRHVMAPGTLAEREATIRSLAGAGWRVSSGFVLGLPGQTPDIIDRTVDLLEDLPLAGCSVSPFIPGEDTPFFAHPAESLERTLNAVAALRLRRPEWIIPAVSAMGMAGEGGYAAALRSGANLATVNLTPHRARGDYQIYKKDRRIMTFERVRDEIEAAGCRPSRTGIRDWLLGRGEISSGSAIPISERGAS